MTEEKNNKSNEMMTDDASGHEQIPVWKNASFWHIAFLMAAFSVFYYMDVIIDYQGWVNMRWRIFYTVHDLHRALFLIPIMYATYIFRLKGIIVTSLLSFIVFLPRALFVSPYPDPLLRALIFFVSMTIMAVLLNLLLNDMAKRKKLEQSLWQSQNDLMLKRAEDKIVLNSQHIQALLQLNQMIESTLKEITDFALEEAVRLTQSKIGYLAFLNEDESVLTMHSWSKSAMAECAISEKPIIYPVVTTGLWGEAVRQRRPIITNDYAADNPLKKGYPQGHVAVKRHMNIPVFIGARLVLVAGVGNKTEDYDQSDIQQLTLLMEDMWRLIERKRVEKALRESEQRLRIFLDSTSDMAFLKDDNYRHLIVNRSLCKFYGKTEEEIIGKTDFDLMTEKEAAQCRKTDKQALFSTAQLINEEVVGGRYYETIKFPVELPEGKKGIGAYIRDITESKKTREEIGRLNAELEQKVAERTRELHDSQLALLNVVDDLNQSVKKTAEVNKQLEETNKELGAFSYSVSHDLRAPLRSIDGFSLALMEDYQNKLDNAGKNYLHKIRAAAQHMGLLIEDILKLSRITHAEFQYQSIDLSKIVQLIADTLQQDNPDRDIKMTIQKDTVIKGDLNSMRIALADLMENAWKFTGKQKCPLIEFGMTLTEGKKVYFIRDNGVGFEMAYADKLFTAFQRLHSTDEFPGTGIGLATVKRIITRHGGQIWAEGEVGKGATFYFTMPE